LLIVAAVLGTIVFFAPAIFAQEANIQYSENGTGPVRTFVSEDPEGAGIDWDVTGLDADDFYIDSRGMLIFNSPPDYENPSDRTEPAVDSVEAVPAGDNMYQIIVRATEKSGETARALSTEQSFTIEVMNEDEDGSITINWLQPEVGTPLKATLRDSDKLTPVNDDSRLIDGGDDDDDIADDVVWQWSYSKVTNPQIDVEGHWADAHPTAREKNALADPTADAYALADTYTPMGDCVDDKEGNSDHERQGCFGVTSDDDPDTATARDEGKYLRVKAVYTDRKGSGNIALAMSANPVRAEVSSDRDNVENPENGSPGFTQGLDYTRSVPESTAKGMPVGAPVVAIDPQDDTLTYELVAAADLNAGDADSFSIDKATGQIKVNGTLDYDANPNTNSPDGKYVFSVKATDPSGEDATVEVTVTATAANDAPAIMGSLRPPDYEENARLNRAPDFGTPDAPAELTVREKDDDNDSYTGFPQMPLPGNTVADDGDGMEGDEEPGLGASNVFTASDEDARGQIFWTIRGDDADNFVITSTGLFLTGFSGPDEPTALRFASAPDYENPTDSNSDSVYEVTIVATDSAGAEDSHDVTVFVENVNEAGEATLSTEQPLIGQAITAGVSDPDNSVAVVTWQWSRSDTRDGDYTPIPGATMDTYVPWKKGKDDGDEVRDDDSMFLRATATYLDTTSDRDLSSTGNVDERVQSDAEGTDSPTAKVAEVTNTGDVESNLYRVVKTSANAVRVSEDSAVATPVFTGAPYEREVAENAETGTIVGLPVSADYRGSLTYTISNADANDNKYFTINTDDGNGQIRVASMGLPDPTPSDQFPVPAVAVGLTSDSTETDMADPALDYESKDSYTLLIIATDSQDPGKKATATVVVNLVNHNEAPYFDKESRDKVETHTVAGAIEPKMIEYAENRRTPVVALAAIEPDGDSLRWELTGANAGVFEIKDIPDGSGTRDRVELAFKNQPNYEPIGKTYNVMVRATEEMDSVGGGPAKAAMVHVRVQVTDIDEKGSVELKWLQPEVGTSLPTIVTDPDVTGAITTDVMYQWFRSKVANPSSSPNIATLGADDSEWETITDATSAAYEPDGDDAATPANEDAVDEDRYLLVRAIYRDGESGDEESDEEETAIGISVNPVRKDVANDDNNSPDFRANKTTRTIDEDTAKGQPVGRPVAVDIKEDNDTLTYELVMSNTGNEGNPEVDTDDVEKFTIDKATGQIMVASPLSYEVGGEAVGEYTLVVRATDPSGEIDLTTIPPMEENRDDIVVTIKVTDVNEAPGVSGDVGLSELDVDEADSSSKNYYVGLGNTADADNITLNGNMYNLYKRTEEDLVDSTSWPEPIGGPDGALFEYSVPADAEGIGRRLHFKSAPDFENPMDANRDNVYEVTINVVDTAGATGQKNIRITVENVDETGKLTVTPAQPHLDGMVMATLTDPDGVESITDWKWYSGPTNVRTDTRTTLIKGATMNYYAPKGDEIVGQFLWAEVEYRDGESVEDNPVTALDERNDAPLDADLGDAEIDSGQIQTLYSSDKDRSTPTDNAVQKDPAGPDPSEYPAQTINLEVAEGTPSTGYVGVPVLTYDPTKTPSQQDQQDQRVNVGGPDGGLFVFAEDYDLAADNYYDAELSSDPAANPPETDTLDKFGQLALIPVTDLDHEGGKNVYTVEVMDEDAANELGVITVIITVTNVNERPSAPAQHFGPSAPANTEPEFAATSTTRMVAENTAAGTAIGDPVEAMDADRGDTLEYTLGGADAASFAIDPATGQLMTSAALDYETDMEYMVTVTATDSEGETDMIYVTIMVTNVGLDNMYDGNDNEVIDRDEVIRAINDYLFGDGSITRDEVIAVINLYLFG
jgi:hypothetical protein